MRRILLCTVTAIPLISACDEAIDWNQIVSNIADGLLNGEVPGDACVLRFSNVTTEDLVGTIEVTYTFSDGSTTTETTDVTIPSDYAADFDTDCPTTIEFNASLGSTPFSFTLEEGEDFECGELLEFAAGPGIYVRFVNTPL